VTGHRKHWIVRKNRKTRRPGREMIGVFSILDRVTGRFTTVIVNRLVRKRMRRQTAPICSPTRPFWFQL